MASLIEYPVIRINPYPLIGTQFTAGLDAVVAADSTVDDVVQAVYDYVQPLYYPYPASASVVENELKAVIYKALNGFGNQPIRSAGWLGNKTSKANVFNNRQQVFVEIMLNGLSNVPVNAIDSYLSDVEDNITNSRLSLKEQAPLLVATLVGCKSYAYWMDKTTTPGDWSGYFSANRAINFANIPYWVSASVQGTLLAATRNDNADKTQNVSINPAHALASGLAVAASRVMLNYVERKIQTQIQQTFLRIFITNEIFNPNIPKSSPARNGPLPWVDCVPGGILSCITGQLNDNLNKIHCLLWVGVGLPMRGPGDMPWLFDMVITTHQFGCYCQSCRGPGATGTC